MEARPSLSEPGSPAPHTALDPELVERKIERYFELCDLAQELGLAGIKHRHPEATPSSSVPADFRPQQVNRHCAA